MAHEQARLTATVDKKGQYCLWNVKGNSKWPKHDPDAIADDMKCIFEIERDHDRFRRLINRKNRLSDWHWRYEYDVDAYEHHFLICLHQELKSCGIKATIKARGIARRGQKKAWKFKTLAYMIYAKENGVLTKLIGLKTIEKRVWRRVYRRLRIPHRTPEEFAE